LNLLRWPTGTPADDYLRDECADPASPLFTVPEQSLAAEFPNADTPQGARRTTSSSAQSGGHR